MAISYSWEKIKEDTRRLSEKLDPQKIDVIVAVARGGLFVAGLLSYLLDKRLVYTYGVKTYEGKRASRSQTLFAPPIGADNARVLIVDDLVDQGLTMRHIQKNYPKAAKVALYVSANCTDLLDNYVEIKPESWIVFPWDFG